jgi:hypothetical protein
MSQSYSIHTEKYDGLFIDCWGDGIANTSDEEAKANAILISKAPEMLEMLKMLLKYTDSIGLFKQIEQLIKEATQI